MAPDLGDDRIGCLHDVGSGESEEPESGIQDEVLPAIVVDETFPVGGSVVLDRQPAGAIKEIHAANESSLVVAEIDLNLRPG